ncbi:HlyD family type I secretion periplasmic adaptor subunit [Bradyrhizobium manausense]|uniref:HlyD family type I secretion periplasmic adaptor subunit n=1 Tax=Bradyrhizobium manausense TaxID=989370 RepID=UPI001BA76EC2|nr:HlyD family type I secretion periplasmic adaptor subunit [Bradyrhizobium manausense]MBR1092293.1 HlyD family type I secretion periplasmic adaptor subunit [Bradyrhizobium manausense]
MSTTDTSLRRHIIATLVSVSFLVLGAGGWAATAKLSGAVIAEGSLVVDSSTKKVQHPTGGIVAQLNVQEGDKVKAGDVLLRLDPTQTQSSLAIVVQSLNELRARKARLIAERDDQQSIAFPQDLKNESAKHPEVAQLLVSEQRFFELRAAARAGQKAQLREKIKQLQLQVEGQTRQATAKQKETDLVTRELIGVRDLYSKGLIQLPRLTQLERDDARLEGEYGQLMSSVAEARGKMVETELQIIQVDQDLRSEDAKDLHETESKIAEQTEKRIAAEDLLNRIDIRAPADGIVYQLTAHTVGGTVDKGEPIMMIVPVNDRLTVEARIPPKSIDQVHVGQRSNLRFTAFNQRTTPEIFGSVSLVAADAATDQKSGASYYTIRIEISPEELAKLGEVKLVPGMPVEAFVQTDARTMASYLVKPIADQLTRAFREH